VNPSDLRPMSLSRIAVAIILYDGTSPNRSSSSGQSSGIPLEYPLPIQSFVYVSTFE